MKLFAPEYYWQLSEEAKQEIGGGCGPGGAGDRLVPDRLLGLSIRPACHIHDVMYHFETNIKGKELADRVLLNNMLRIIETKTKYSWFQVPRKILALGYYFSVKWFGAPAFWKGKNKETEEREVVFV